MGLIKDLKRNKKNQAGWKEKSKDLFENKNKMPWHIYTGEKPESYSDHVKQFNWIHYVLKGKAIVPTLWIASKWLKPHLQKDIPPFWYNKNLILFEQAFDKSLFEWYKYFIINLGKHESGFKYPSDEEINKRISEHASSKELMIMKDLMMTIIQQDTAYREFFNMLMFNITLTFQKEYGGKGSIHHPLYISHNISDKQYYILGRMVQQGPTQPVQAKTQKKSRC